MKLAHALIPALLLSLAAGAASAKVLASATRSTNFTYTADGTPVPLNDSGSTSMVFNVAKAGTYSLTYSAECSADNGANSNSGWVHLDLEVNGVVVAPTVGSSDAFCSPDNVAGSSGWVRVSITVPVRLLAGNNTVRVLGGLVSVSTGWLGDTALVIQ
ncbi:hypothetical protein [Ideonella sp. YS5]|uniref:hypothetical protein n=1 Tax=Ideonella sp. YS5 TaxID=3453714 RepID=UPI003EF087A4